MKTFAGRSTIQIRDLDRSQEFRVFHESAKVTEDKPDGLYICLGLILS